MAERRVPQIVAQTGDLNEVWVSAQRHAKFATDLPHFKAVRQSGARKVLFAGNDHLGLARKSPQPGRVQYAGAVSRERRPTLPLRRFRDESLFIVLAIAG